jgi:hypothetical protein
MIFRIFIILMIIIFQDQIFNFLKKIKMDTVGKAKKTVMKNTKKMVGNIINNEVNNSLDIVKRLDKSTHKKCIKIIKNIYRIKDDVENDRHIDFKNEFENMKFQKKEILNIIAALVVSKGFFSSQDSIIEEIEEFINNMLIELLDLADKKDYNINWFEDNIYEAEPNDTGAPNFSYHYNLF